MQQFLPRLLVLVCAFFIMDIAFGQAPANDDCANAIAVGVDTLVTFNTTEATTSGPAHADDCTSSGTTPDSTYKDIWYTFTATFDGLARWDLCGGTTGFDTKIFVYGPGTTCPPTDDDIVACNEDGGGSCDVVSQVDFEVTNGETYLLRLGGFGDGGPGESGPGDFTITEFIPSVPNDFCASAIQIGLVTGYMIDTNDATQDGPDHPDNPCFQFGDLGMGRDIWFTYTADFTGSVQWSTCDLINFDSRLAVYGPNATCPVTDEDLYACNDDGAGCTGFTSLLIFDVEEGNTYTLRLGGYNNAGGIGTFDLVEIIPPDPPANDLCDTPDESPFVIDRQSADDLDILFEGSTLNGGFDPETFEFPVCLSNQSGGEFSDVWYTFNSRSNTELEIPP